jgi:hypothetical protein
MEHAPIQSAQEVSLQAMLSHDLFDVYAVAIEDTNQLKSYGQRIDSVYVTIVTLILAGDAYVAANSKFDNWLSVVVTGGIGIVGVAFCLRWLRGLSSVNDILVHRYEWLRNLESTAELEHLRANLFTEVGAGSPVPSGRGGMRPHYQTLLLQ